MSSKNLVILIGRVGQNPETKTFDNGNKVANFSLATSEKWKDKNGEPKEATEWHNIAVFNKMAEVVEKYVKKGDLLYIQGQLKTRSWEKDGEKRYITEVVINSFGDTLTMLGSKGNSESKPTSEANSLQSPPPVEEEEGLLPF